MRKQLTIISCTVAVTLATCVLTNGAITYVDITDGASGNTMCFTNGQWTVWEGYPGQTSVQNDGVWDERGFGNNATIYQNAGYGQVDTNAVPLRTTVSVQPGTYDVYVFFWSDVSQWRVSASLTGLDNMTLYAYNASGGYPVPAGAVYRFWPSVQVDPPVHSGDQGTHYSDELSPNPFTTRVMIAEGNRVLLGAYLGQVSGSTISVFMGPDPNQSSFNQRTWLDGIGYQLVPEPTTLALLGFGLFIRLLRVRATRQ